MAKNIKEVKIIDGVVQMVDNEELSMMMDTPYEINEGEEVIHDFDTDKLLSQGAMPLEDIINIFKQENGIR